MLQPYIGYCCPGFILLSLILWAIAGYSYRVTAKRPADDPNKRLFRPAAVHLVPVIWLPFILLAFFIFVLKILLYGIFLILFTFALVVIRKPFLLLWLEKIAGKIGNALLEANTFLIRAAFAKWDGDTRPL